MDPTHTYKITQQKHTKASLESTNWGHAEENKKQENGRIVRLCPSL